MVNRVQCDTRILLRIQTLNAYTSILYHDESSSFASISQAKAVNRTSISSAALPCGTVIRLFVSTFVVYCIVIYAYNSNIQISGPET